MANEILERLATVAEKLDNQSKLLDKHSSILEEHGRVLLRNTITVEEHHKRSTSLEVRQDALEIKVEVIKDEVSTSKSNKQYLKDFFITVGQIAVGIPAIGGALWGLYQLLQKLGI